MRHSEPQELIDPLYEAAYRADNRHDAEIVRKKSDDHETLVYHSDELSGKLTQEQSELREALIEVSDIVTSLIDSPRDDWHRVLAENEIPLGQRQVLMDIARVTIPESKIDE